jgi:hypothetical protein
MKEKKIEIRVTKNLPGTENHHRNEFEMTILIVLQISRVSLLQNMLIDVQYTISIKINESIQTCM